MSEILISIDDRPVHTSQDVRALYVGTDDNPHLDAPRIGIEIEQTLYHPDTLELVDKTLSAKLTEQGKSDGIPVHHEPSSTSLEVVTDAFTPDDLQSLLDQIEDRFSYFRNIITREGLCFSPFGHLPHVFSSDHDVVDKERFQTFFNPPRADMQEVFQFFANAMNIQVSVSYRNPDHLLRIVRLAVALEPILFSATDSNCGFFENEAIDYSLPLYLNTQKGINGGIPDFYYSARNGQEFLDSHIDFTLNHPHIFAYFDFNGKLKKLPEGQWVAFSDLERLDLGPQTLVNYRQSQSESWRRAANIAAITNADGQVIGHRAELASFQTGLMHQRFTAPFLTNLFAFDECFQSETEVLLKDVGIDVTNLSACRDVLESNFQEACYHQNRFHELPFGSGTIKDFVLPFADLIESSYQNTPFKAFVKPIIHIFRSGRPDWLVYREHFRTLEVVKAYLKEFPDFVAEAEEDSSLLSALHCADDLTKTLQRFAA